MTLGNAAAARVRLIVWCRVCCHQVEPDPAELVGRYDTEKAVLDWCGSREIDTVVSGIERRRP